MTTKTPSDLPLNRRDNPESFLPWTVDYSVTYILHTFKMKRGPGWFQVTGFNELTPGYVLRRQSNIARALYIIAKRMVDEGLIFEGL